MTTEEPTKELSAMAKRLLDSGRKERARKNSSKPLTLAQRAGWEYPQHKYKKNSVTT